MTGHLSTSDSRASLEAAFGHKMPSTYWRLLELGLVDLGQWRVLTPGEVHALFGGINGRYPCRTALPIARRIDCDDVAIFVTQGPESEVGKALIIHDYASPGYEVDSRFESIWGWLRLAVEELIANEERDPRDDAPP